MDVQSLIKKQNRLFWGFFLGTAVVLLVIIFLLTNDFMKPLISEEHERIMMGIGFFIAVAGGGGSIWHGRKTIKALESIEDMKTKIEGYHKLVIQRMIIVEITAIVSLILYILAGAKALSFLPLAMIFLLRINKPSLLRLLRELDIPENELIKFSNNEENS